MLQFALCFGVALGISAALTPLVARWGRTHGMVALPRQDRWHRQPTPLLGGVAIFVGTSVAIFLFAHHDTRLIGLEVGGALLFVTGLIDDFRHLRPHTKLIAQILAACVMVVAGCRSAPRGWQRSRFPSLSCGSSASPTPSISWTTWTACRP